MIYKQWLSCKESACIAGDAVSSPGLGRFPGGGNGKPLQNSCLGNPTDRESWWATVHGNCKRVRHDSVTKQHLPLGRWLNWGENTNVYVSAEKILPFISVIFFCSLQFSLSKSTISNLWLQHTIFICRKKDQKQTCGYYRGNVGGGINQELGINEHTLLYVR